MSEATWLYVFLALIYIGECCGWTSKQTVLFRNWMGSAKRPSRHWSWYLPGKWFGNEQYGLHLRTALPPLGNVFHCPVLPASISPIAALAWVPFAMESIARPDQLGTLIEWNGATNLPPSRAEGKVVFLNGQRFVHCASEAHAQHLSRLTAEVQKAPDSASREAVINAAWQSAFDSSAIQAALDRFSKETFSLRLITNLLFVFLFLIAPLCVLQLGFGTVWLPLILVLALLMIGAAVVFYRTHRRLRPRLVNERWKYTSMVLLSPPAAVRSLDALARDALIGFHPLSVANVVFENERFLDFARRYILDLRFAMPSHLQTDSTARDTLQWHMRREAQHIRGFLDTLNLAVDDLTLPDPPADAGCKSYCPRCQCQFVIPEGRCTLCDLPLVAFA